MRVTLHTERLYLTTSNRRMVPDILNFYERNKEHLEPWESERDAFFYTKSYQRLLQRYENRNMRRMESIDFWMYDFEQHQLIGKVAVFHITRGNFSNCVIGYKLDKEFQSQGLMHEALQEVLRFLFEDLHIHRAEINIIPSNERSVHVAERLGFSRECISKEFVEVNGIWQDHARYSLTVSDWKEKRKLEEE